MSFGSLSKNAILALNGGAKLGNFAHNTGEGGLSPYHLEPGGDIIWQIGTGYFGCRDERGNFSADLFKERSSDERVKMIEIKLSQGAKPGHGGILPKEKLTPEISKIRNTPKFVMVFRLLWVIPFLKIVENTTGRHLATIWLLCVGCSTAFVLP